MEFRSYGKSQHPGEAGVLALLCALVFAAGGQAAPDVTLGLVLVQDGLCLKVERAVAQRQTLRQVLVYGGFAQAEVLGGGANRRLVLYDVKSQVFGPVFQIVFDNTPLPCCYWPIYMAGAGKL